MLTARTEAEPYVEAAQALKGVAYACRGCGAPVILHAGQIRVRHFAHRPGTPCVFGAKMSLAHLNTQTAIAAALRARGVIAELESWLPGLKGDRRIDVLAHPADAPDRRVAIEVQQADLTDAVIEARTRSYQVQGVAPLWLRLLDFGRFEQVQALPFSGDIWIDRYPARSWERWAHDRLNGGHLWCCNSGTGRLWRAQFMPAFGWREAKDWYDTWGDYQSISEHYEPVARWVGLALRGPFEPGELRLTRGRTQPAVGAPQLAGWFVPPDELDRKGAPVADLRQEVRTDRHWRQTCVLEHGVDDRWVPAALEGARSDWRTQAQPRRPVVG